MSFLLNDVLCVLRFCAGCVVIANWGYKVGEVIAATRGVPAWTVGLAVNTDACWQTLAEIWHQPSWAELAICLFVQISVIFTYHSVAEVFNTCQLGGNFVSYMLDSVPLGRFCQQAWAPDFKDTWSAADIGRYLTYTLPVPAIENKQIQHDTTMFQTLSFFDSVWSSLFNISS